jgi:hypothetical protein
VNCDCAIIDLALLPSAILYCVSGLVHPWLDPGRQSDYGCRGFGSPSNENPGGLSSNHLANAAYPVRHFTHHPRWSFGVSTYVQ